MTTAQATIDALARDREASDVVRLAESVSFAVRVDHALLRAARRRFLPHRDAVVEAMLWFSPLVQFATPDGIAFAPDVAKVLRQRLARDPERYESAWMLTDEQHAALSQVIRLEERIAWLQYSGSPDAPRRLRECFRRALAALVAGDRSSLARWAARALPQFPPEVRGLEEAQLLESGARMRLDGDLRSGDTIDPDTPLSPEMAWVVPKDLPREEVGVRVYPGVIEFTRAEEVDPAMRIGLPWTDPLVVEVEEKVEEDAEAQDKDGEEHRAPRRVRVELGVDWPHRVRVAQGSVRLHTVLGETFVVEPMEGDGADTVSEIFDFAFLRDRHAEFHGREDVMERIGFAIETPDERAGGLVMRGTPGAGKTALLVNALGRLGEGKLAPAENLRLVIAAHFVTDEVAGSDDRDAAIRSLCAQIELARPELVGHPAPPTLRFRRLLDRFDAEAELLDRLVLVVDGVETIFFRADERAALLPLVPRVASSIRLIGAVNETNDAVDERLQGQTDYIDLVTVESGEASAIRQFLEAHAGRHGWRPREDLEAMADRTGGNWLVAVTLAELEAARQSAERSEGFGEI